MKCEKCGADMTRLVIAYPFQGTQITVYQCNTCNHEQEEKAQSVAPH